MSLPPPNTAPLVEAGLDLRSFPDMPLGVARLRDSDLVAFASEKAFRAAVLLWCAAWHQVPASSLPADESRLAHYAGFGKNVKAWLKVKEEAMRGFVLCTDGRLYHQVIAEKAIEADNRRRAFRERTANATKARRTSFKGRDVERDVVRNDDEEKGREGKVEDAAAGARASADETIMQAIGVADNPNWYGHRPRIIEWTVAWDVELDILPTIKRLMAQRTGPPRSPKFFEEAIAEHHARRLTPLPKVVVNNKPETIHVEANQRHPGGAYGASKDRFRAAHAELKASLRANEDGGNGSGQAAELLPAARRE